jgi:hypothetical protein
MQLTPAGVTALRASGLAKPLTDGSGFYIRGLIIVPRDASGRPTLAEPGLNFMFAPMTAPNKFGPARQMKWMWVTGGKIEIDTLDDLRGIVSNRDLRYGGWEAGLRGLLSEVDTDDSIFHTRSKGAAPGQPNNGVFLAEGWLSRNLLSGHIPDQTEMEAYLFKVQHSIPRADPLSYRPNDPLVTANGGGLETVYQLLQSIARAEKYGEAEPGFLDAARIVARFLCEDLYPPDDALSGPSSDRAMFIERYAIEARQGLITQVSFIGASTLMGRLSRPSRLGNTVADKIRSEGSYLAYTDVAPITFFDVARAGVEIMGDLKTPRYGNVGTESIVRSLVEVASQRSDFRARETNLSLPVEVSSLGDAVGKIALEKLHLLTSDKTSSASGAYRNVLLAVFCDVAANPGDKIGNPSMVGASAEAVIRAGVGSTAEVVQFINSVWDLGLVLAIRRSPFAQDAVRVLRGVNADARVRSTYDAYLAKRIRDFQQRQDDGNGTLDERRWLAMIAG